jgi:hypothetical protein
MAGKQLLPGFNHNVRHGAQVYHVQTEDAGSAAAHVTTQLFLGGTVLATRRTSYAAEVGSADLARTVKLLMETQHKAVMRALVAGEIEGVPPAARAPAAAAPAAATAASHAPATAPAAAPEGPPSTAPAALPPPRAPAGEPPVLSRVPRSRASRPPVRPSAARAAPPRDPGDRRLDDLVLAYLAEDLAAKGGR